LQYFQFQLSRFPLLLLMLRLPQIAACYSFWHNKASLRQFAPMQMHSNRSEIDDTLANGYRSD
jgi:hypothetical protein